MPVTRERFAQGLTYDAYKAQMTRNRERFEANKQTVELASIELIPWQDGAFDVVVDGALVHSMYRHGGFPEPAAMIGAVRERLGHA